MAAADRCVTQSIFEEKMSAVGSESFCFRRTWSTIVSENFFEMCPSDSSVEKSVIAWIFFPRAIFVSPRAPALIARQPTPEGKHYATAYTLCPAEKCSRDLCKHQALFVLDSRQHILSLLRYCTQLNEA